jgi:prepilin-type N-terminal cleavage/methylation domain-containing protein
MFKNLKLQNIQSKLKGFTLLELMIVMAIMAVLATLIYPSFNSALAASRDAKIIADLKNIQTDLLLYAQSTSNGEYYPNPLYATANIDGTTVDCGEQNSTYPYAKSCAMMEVYKYLSRKAPDIVISGDIKYVGIGCEHVLHESEGVPLTDYNKDCKGYQLWVELEGFRSALNSDSDLNTTDTTAFPNTYGYAINGTVENCADNNENTLGIDCVFDMTVTN